MKKRFITIALSVAMISSMFVGCSGSGDSSSKESSSTGSSSTGESSVEESSSDGALEKFDDVKLKFLQCWNGGFKNPEDTYGNEVATAIRDKIGVTVEIEGIMMSETEKLNLVFASGDMPDMIGAPYWGGDAGETAVLKKAGAEGRLLALDDHIGKYENIKDAWKVGIVSQAFLESDLEIPAFEGKHYILPTQTPGEVESITNWIYGVFCRKDIIEAIGIDPASIKTSDDLYNFMVKVRDGGFKDVNGNPVIPASLFGNGWSLPDYTVNFREKKFTDFEKGEDGKYTHRRLTEGWVDEAMFVWKLINENILDKESIKHSDTVAREKAGNGTSAIVCAQYGGAAIASQKASGLYNTNPEMKYMPLGPLTFKDGTPQTQIEYYGRGGTPCIVFPTTNKNLDASLAWLNYLNSEEGARLAQYGIEGKTYSMVDGQPRLLPEIIERKKIGDEALENELRNIGMVYGGPTLLADKRMSWWGEMGAGDADAEDPDVKAYKLLKPVEQIKGYPIDKLSMSFPEYETVKRVMFEGTREQDAREMAYFAKTEAEARKILTDYQEYLKTAENGVVLKYLAYVDEVSTSRDDVID